MRSDDVLVHSEWMRRLARALVGDAAADDVVQEAWTRLGERREAPGYLAAVVRSLARDLRRGESRRGLRERRAARPEALPATEDVAARSELVRRLAAAVDELEEPLRTTIVLRYYDDLSSAEIARRTAAPEGTVRARLKRGLDRLRSRLDAEGGGRERWMSALVGLARAGGVEPGLALSGGALASAKVALVSVILLTGLALGWKALSGGAANPRAVTLASPIASQTGARDPQVAEARGDLVGREVLVPSGAPSSMPTVPADAATDRVRARAVDPDGKPLREAWMQLRLESGAGARAGLDGALQLTLPAGRLDERASMDLGRLVAIDVGAPGRRTRTLCPYLGEDPAAATHTIELGDVSLEPGSAVEGRVVDVAGRAIADALVVVGPPLDERPIDSARRTGPVELPTWSGSEPLRTARSDTAGAFRVEGLAAGHATAWARTATSLWAFSAPIGLRPGEEVRGVELVVPEGVAETLSGRVVDPDGRPLGGITVRFSPSVGEQGWIERATDVDGAFHLVATGATDLRVRSPSWEWDDCLLREVQPGTHDLRIAFQASRWWPVRVQDESGLPVHAGRVVGVSAADPKAYPVARFDSWIDAQGRARIRRGAETLRLRVESPGYRERVVGPFSPEAWPDPLVVRLERAPALVGRVRDAEGRPVAGAEVSLHVGAAPGKVSFFTHQGWGGDGEPFVHTVRSDAMVRATTDAEGRYRLTLPGREAGGSHEVAGVGQLAELGYGGAPDPATVARTRPDERPWYVHAALAGATSVTSGPLGLDGTEDVEVDLRLPPGGSISGRLVTDDGSSPAGWTIWATDGRADDRSAPVASDGTFRFDALHAGGWQLRAFEPAKRHYPDSGRLQTDRAPVFDVEVVAGRTVTWLHAVRRAESARLRGRLTLDGNPPGPARVRVATTMGRGSYEATEATLDPDGRFEVALRPDREVSISVVLSVGEAQWSLVARPAIVSGVNEWSVDVPTARLEGSIAPRHHANRDWGLPIRYRVLAEDWEAIVSFDPGEGGLIEALCVPAGHGVLHGPDPGAWLAELDLEKGETRRVTIE